MLEGILFAGTFGLLAQMGAVFDKCKNPYSGSCDVLAFRKDKMTLMKEAGIEEVEEAKEAVSKCWFGCGSKK